MTRSHRPGDRDENRDGDDPARLVRAYYDALDAGEYDRLAALLAPDFVQRRPDRTFEGRDRFVAFMRDERPMTDTSHAVDAVCPSGPDGSDESDSSGSSDPSDASDLSEPSNESDGSGVAVRGRLLDADGDEVFAFVDVFSVEDGRIAALETYAAEDDGSGGVG